MTMQGKILGMMIAGGALMLTIGHADARAKRLWKAVPGHKNIMVDMASIAPMHAGRTMPTTGNPHMPILGYEETMMSIKLNGNLVEHYVVTCSGFGFGSKESAAVYSEQVMFGGAAPKVIGYVPTGALEKLVCPRARELAMSGPKSKQN